MYWHVLRRFEMFRMCLSRRKQILKSLSRWKGASKRGKIVIFGLFTEGVGMAKNRFFEDFSTKSFSNSFRGEIYRWHIGMFWDDLKCLECNWAIENWFWGHCLTGKMLQRGGYSDFLAHPSPTVKSPKIIISSSFEHISSKIVTSKSVFNGSITF